MIPASDGSEMREPTIRMAKLIKLMIESCDYIVNRFFLNLKTNTFTLLRKHRRKRQKALDMEQKIKAWVKKMIKKNK